MTIVSAIALYGEGTPGLEFRILWGGNGYEVSRGTATDTHVIIPDTHNGLPVLVIAQYGFQNYVDLVSIELPNTIVGILEIVLI